MSHVLQDLLFHSDVLLVIAAALILGEVTRRIVR
jgi:hypothetical protein